MQEKLLSVPYIDQTLEWPTGCESVSAVMLLNYLGVDISVAEFVRFLPKISLSEWRDQEKEESFLIGADPSQYFIGSPDDPDGFGCYAPVISSTLNEIFRRRNLPWTAKNVSASSTDTLLSAYIDHGMPVIYWATIDLLEYKPGPSWKLYTPEGPLFRWRSNEHCMLLTGYTADRLQFNDPWHNHGVILYGRELVDRRHTEMFSMAVAVEPL